MPLSLLDIEMDPALHEGRHEDTYLKFLSKGYVSFPLPSFGFLNMQIKDEIKGHENEK